jgi:hypothetical protein
MWKISNQQHNLQLRTKESSSEKTSRSETICSRRSSYRRNQKFDAKNNCFRVNHYSAPHYNLSIEVTMDDAMQPGSNQ